MPTNYISPISMDAISELCGELNKNNYIDPHDFERYEVKRGLRNSDSTGVMAGLRRAPVLPRLRHQRNHPLLRRRGPLRL